MSKLYDIIKKTSVNNRPKAVVFYTYLPPWRIDVFNEMGKLFDLTIVFLNPESEGFTYNRKRLSEKLMVDHIFLPNAIRIKGKTFAMKGVVRLLRELNPRVVFSHEYSPTSNLIALLLKIKLFSFKYIITTSNNEAMAKSAEGFKKKARKFVLDNASGLVVYSNKVRDFYASEFNHLNIQICPNIQDPKTLLGYSENFSKYKQQYEERYYLKGKQVILYIGRLVQVKGLDLLIAAFAKSNYKNTKLVLVGDGIELENLKESAKEKGIINDVVFPGFFDGEALYAWYSFASFFVLPSRYEPFGAVVNEALVYGCPVIASKFIGALDFINHGENGLIFNPLNEEEFVRTLNDAIKNYSLETRKTRNLMLDSFSTYVDSFIKVIKD